MINIPPFGGMTWLREAPYILNRNTEGRLMAGKMPPIGGTAARDAAMGLPAKRDRRTGRDELLPS